MVDTKTASVPVQRTIAAQSVVESTMDVLQRLETRCDSDPAYRNRHSHYLEIQGLARWLVALIRQGCDTPEEEITAVHSMVTLLLNEVSV